MRPIHGIHTSWKYENLCVPHFQSEIFKNYHKAFHRAPFFRDAPIKLWYLAGRSERNNCKITNKHPISALLSFAPTISTFPNIIFLIGEYIFSGKLNDLWDLCCEVEKSCWTWSPTWRQRVYLAVDKYGDLWIGYMDAIDFWTMPLKISCETTINGNRVELD